MLPSLSVASPPASASAPHRTRPRDAAGRGATGRQQVKGRATAASSRRRAGPPIRGRCRAPSSRLQPGRGLLVAGLLTPDVEAAAVEVDLDRPGARDDLDLQLPDPDLGAADRAAVRHDAGGREQSADAEVGQDAAVEEPAHALAHAGLIGQLVAAAAAHLDLPAWGMEQDNSSTTASAPPSARTAGFCCPPLRRRRSLGYYVVPNPVPSPVAPSRPEGVRCRAGVDAGGSGCDPRTPKKARGGRSSLTARSRPPSTRLPALLPPASRCRSTLDGRTAPSRRVARPQGSLLRARCQHHRSCRPRERRALRLGSRIHGCPAEPHGPPVHGRAGVRSTRPAARAAFADLRACGCSCAPPNRTSNRRAWISARTINSMAGRPHPNGRQCPHAATPLCLWCPGHRSPTLPVALAGRLCHDYRACGR